MHRHLLCCLLASCLLACSSTPPQPPKQAPVSLSAPAVAAAPSVASVELEELAPGVWMHTSHKLYKGVIVPSNGLVVLDGDALILVDSAWGEQATETLLARIEATIGRPIKAAIVTHSHEDRLSGVDLLKARGVRVYAHPETIAHAQAKGASIPDAPLESLAQAGSWASVGEVEVFYPGHGHAPENLMVWVPGERVLFGGCAVREASAASLGNTQDADLKLWEESVQRALQRYSSQAEIVVPGHGPQGDRGLLEHTLSLLSSALEECEELAP